MPLVVIGDQPPSNESRLSGGRVSPPSAQHLPYPQVSRRASGRPRSPPLQALVRWQPRRHLWRSETELRLATTPTQATQLPR